MADMQRQLRDLTDAGTRTTEWMRTHEARATDVDKFLGTLREGLDALQSAGLFSGNEEHCVRLAPAKDCRISGLGLPQAILAKPHSRRE